MFQLIAHSREQLRAISKPRRLIELALGVALIPSLVLPAAARPTIIIRSGGALRPPPPSTYIYGSPIPAPVPVNPVTGHVQRYDYNPYGRPYRQNNSYRGLYPSERYRYGRRSRRVRDSLLVNPTIIDSDIRNSVLVNPVIIRRD